MVRIKKTISNPHALSTKQKLVIDTAVATVKKTGKLDIVAIHKKIYKGKSATVSASHNINRYNFRSALVEGLTERGILGKNSLIERRLSEGLNATLHSFGKKKIADHGTRLDYIKEINKISGVYAPEKSEKRSISLNIDTTPEELNANIQRLQAELATP